jgi:uncharacterized protein
MVASVAVMHRLWSPAACRTLGGLMEVCEDSYHALAQLAPDLRRARGHLRARVAAGADLHLQVLEQSRYTTLIRLTYAFPHHAVDGSPCLDPNARLCVYHDAMQVEVLDLHQSVLPIYRHYARPALDAKWNANLFLARWLAYCVGQGYRFGTAVGAAVSAVDLLSSGRCESV